jgi:hypothetical protein
MTIQGVKILSATPKDQDDLVTRGSERIANYILSKDIYYVYPVSVNV